MERCHKCGVSVEDHVPFRSSITDEVLCYSCVHRIVFAQIRREELRREGRKEDIYDN